jgi:hypothetical protein
MPALKATATTTNDALEECENWIKPSRIKVRPDGKYHQIVQLDYSERKEDEKRNESEYEPKEWEQYIDDFS